LTFAGIYESLQNVNRSLLTDKEAFDESLSKFKSYSMGLQVSSELDSEISEGQTLMKRFALFEKMMSHDFYRLNSGVNYLDPAIALEQSIAPGCLKISQRLGGGRLLGGLSFCFKFSQAFISNPEHLTVTC